MQNISLNFPSKVYLQEPSITDDSYNITYSIFDEISNYVKGTDNIDIKNVTAIYDDTEKKYKAEFTLNVDTKGAFVRIAFNIRDKDGNFVQSNYYMVECRLIDDKVNTIQLVPVSDYKDWILNAEMDTTVKEMIASYPESTMRDWLLSAHAQLERDLQMTLTSKTIDREPHDFRGQQIMEDWWLIRTFETPIIKVNSYALWLGRKQIWTLKPNNLIVKKIEAEIQYLPINNNTLEQGESTGSLESIGLMGMGGLAGADYIPEFFQVSYDHGLDYMNMSRNEQADIRTAIIRRAFIDSMILIKPNLLKGSESGSADGISYSYSNQVLPFLNKEKASLKKWVDDMRTYYMKDFIMGGAA